jgi:ParB/RepB/Spo0J family partition protein
MPQQIAIGLIDKNPYQSRKRIDKLGVERLAEEIKQQGFWDTALRVRQCDGRYQLVFGHQRLEALRELGHKRVNVEIIKLDDLTMAQQSLIENLQRDNLLEVDKAEAIARLLEMMLSTGRASSRPKAIEELCKLLGFASSSSIEQFLTMANMTEPTKQIMRRANTGRAVAKIARAIGGERMVRVAAEKGIGVHSLEPMVTHLTDLPDTARKKVVERIIEKKISDPEEVKKLARREAQKTADLDRVPPDIMLFIMKWTKDLDIFADKFDQASKVKSYVHEHPEIVGEFRTAFERFCASGKRLLNL